jgi:hypothetical protein
MGLPVTQPPSWLWLLAPLLFKTAPLAPTLNWLKVLTETPPALGGAMLMMGTPLPLTVTIGRCPVPGATTMGAGAVWA